MLDERIKQLETNVNNLIGIVEIFINHIRPDGELCSFTDNEMETLFYLNMNLNVIKEEIDSKKDSTWSNWP